MNTTLKTIVLALAVAATALTAAAQTTTGRWTVHTKFAASQAVNCIDTGNEVYYLSLGNLFRYDKATQENEALSNINDLSDTGVKQIYYSGDSKLLVVAYDNANVDIIDSNGRVTNLPFIKDASLTGEKVINDVSFAAGDRIFVATNFGYVVLDAVKMEVAESRIFNKDVQSIAIVGDKVFLASEGNMLAGYDAKRYNTLADYQPVNVQAGRITPVGDHRFILNTGWTSMVTVEGDDLAALTFHSSVIAQAAPRSVQRTPEGWLLSYYPADYHYTTDAAGDNAQRHDGGGLFSQAAAGELWVLNEQGLSCIKGDQQSEPFTPNGIGITTTPFWLAYDPGNDRVVVASTTDNAVLTRQNYGAKTEIFALSDGFWSDITPSGVPVEDNDYNNGNNRPVFSPHQDDTYFFSTRASGLCRVQGNQVTQVYNSTNSPLAQYAGVMQFDNAGNLWLVQPYQNPTAVMALPRSKQNGTANASDWVTNAVNGTATAGFKRAQFAIGDNDTKVFTAGDMGDNVVFWRNNATTLAVENSTSYPRFTDQDGNEFSWSYVYCLTPDANGDVWMGTNSGVIAFTPSEALDKSSFRINHLKVPRDDGSGLADYLLAGMAINCIAVDGTNRKWIGSHSNGIYLVSEDGSKILAQFNTDNSELTSNRIYDILCVPGTNRVMVVTANSVMEYSSDATPGASSYSNIYAYPNPVRPNYYGNITITGLMANSLVKIADPAGNVVASVKSSGGMATWNGCNYSGEPVGSGVYIVYASQNDNGSSAAVTKILIIR